MSGKKVKKWSSEKMVKGQVEKTHIPDSAYKYITEDLNMPLPYTKMNKPLFVQMELLIP